MKQDRKTNEPMARGAKRLIPSRVRWLLGDQLRTVTALTFTALLTGICEASILAIFAEAASALVRGKDSVVIELGPLSMHLSIELLLGVGFGLSLARLGLGFVQAFLSPRITGNIQAKLRRELLTAFMGASWSVQSQDREGHLQEIMTNQASQASLAAGAATGLVASILTFLVLVVTALLLSPFAVLIILLMAGVLFAILHPVRAKGRTETHALSGAQMEFANIVGETNRMAEETQVFGVTEAQDDLVGSYVDRARELFIRTQAMLGLAPRIYQGVMYLFMIVGLAAIYATSIGGIASLGAVVLLLIRAGTYGQEIQGEYHIIHQSMPFIDRIIEKTREYERSIPTDGDEPLMSLSTMSFEGVCFEYRPGAQILSDIDFEVVAGEAIGIIGPSGAGKSTIAQILLRLREPSEGRYLVNGKPATDFLRKDWQARVACVPQEPHLIHASVADNIRYFRDLDDRQVEEAARLAHIHDEVESWTDGYDTIVGPRADAVSGGQQQRICLARALAAQPALLILDEPTSALDPRSERLVKKSLGDLRHHLTIFIVAHGATLLDICDRVMVVDGGRLEAFGPTSSIADTTRGLGLEAMSQGTV